MIHPRFIAPGLAAFLFVAGCDLFVDDATRIARAQSSIESREFRAAEIELKNVLRSDPHNPQARILLGQTLLQRGDAAAAAKELERARDMDADAAAYMPTLARALVSAGRFNEVVELDASLIGDGEKRAEVIALIGRAEAGLGNIGAARKQFDAAIALSPAQPDASIGLALIAASEGDAKGAAERLQKLLAERPDDPDAIGALARMQFTQRDFAAAEKSFARAVEATPQGQLRERMIYLAGLSEAQLSQGNTATAQETVVKLLQISNEHPLAQMQAARVDYALANYDSVIDRTQQVIARLPEYEPPRLMLAAAALAKGNRVLAVTQLQSVININPGNDHARKLLAQAHMELNSHDDALEVLQPMLETARPDPYLLAMAGTANVRSGKQEAGVSLLERSVELGNADPALAMQSAAALLAAGEINRAIEVLQSLPETERVSHRDLLLVLAQLQAGDEDAARTHARTILESRPGDAEAHQLMGGLHLAVREYEAARTQFEAAYELNPAEHSAVIALARIDIVEGKPEAATARLQSLLEREPGNLMALTALAQLAEQRGDPEAAIRLIEQSIEANPQALAPPLRLGRYYLAQGDLQRAEQMAQRAIRAAPNRAAGHELLAAVHLRNARLSEAIISLDKAVTVEPGNSSAHLALGGAQQQSGQLDAAFSSFETALKLDPDSLKARLAMAGAHMARGDIDVASNMVEELIKDHPERSEPLIIRGDLAVRREDWRDALTAYDSAAALASSRMLAARRSELRNRLGDDNAEAPLEAWMKDNPDDLTGRAMLAQAYLAGGRFDRAIAEYENVMSEAPDGDTAVKIAVAHERNGNLDEAARWLQQAAQLDADVAAPRLALASLELRRGNAERAAQIARELRGQYPKNDQIHQLEGAALFALGKFTESASAYQRAAAIAPSQQVVLDLYQAQQKYGKADSWRVLEQWLADHPDDIPVSMQLALHYDGENLSDEAIEIYRRVLYAVPDNFVVLNNLAWVYYKRGDDGDIKRGVNSALRAYKLRKDVPAVVDTYGWLLLQDGRLTEALPLLKTAATAASGEPEIVYHYAVALEQSGDGAAARQWLNRALATETPFESRDKAEALLARL